MIIREARTDGIDCDYYRCNILVECLGSPGKQIVRRKNPGYMLVQESYTFELIELHSYFIKNISEADLFIRIK